LLLANASAQAGGDWTSAGHIRGTQTYERAGWAIAALGDLDADGVPELAVGLPGYPLGSSPGEVRVYSGRTMSMLYQVVDQSPIDGLGYSVAAAGDVNADGIPDLVAGAAYSHPYTVNGITRFAGAVLVYSGADGSVLHHIPGDQVHHQLGTKVACAGDIDLDGHDDIIVSANHYPSGYVQVLSGASGQAIHTVQGPHLGSSFGWTIAGLGDLDGDGHPEFAAGDSASWHQEVHIYSGATGQTHQILYGEAASGAHAFGCSILDLEDIDGDGVSDFAVGDLTFSTGGAMQDYGRVSIYSGATTSLLTQIESPELYGHFGASLAGPLDFNGDGRTDLAVGLPGAPAFVGGTLYDQGAVKIHDCLDGQLLSTIRPVLTGADPMLGTSLAAPGDLDGDGVPEVIAGAPFDRLPGAPKETGSVMVFSYDSFQRLDSPTLSAGGSQTVTVTVDFPDTEAGADYLLAFSRNGTGPMQVGPLSVPLSPDPLQALTASGWQPGNVVGGQGILGSAGEAQILIQSHPSLSPLIGREVYLATISFTASSRQPRLSSGPGVLEIVP